MPYTRLPASLDDALTIMAIQAAGDDDAADYDSEDYRDAVLAGQLLEIKRRADAALDAIKDRQYERRIGVVGESEAIIEGVKIKVVGPTTAKGIDTQLARQVDNDSRFRQFMRDAGYPADTLTRHSQRRGYCSLTEVK